MSEQATELPQTRKKRSFTAELLLWIVMLVVLPVVVFQALFYMYSFNNLKRMEQERMTVANLSAQKAIESLGESILGVTVTNAYWEDNRNALIHRDLVWLESNVGDMPEIVSGIDFVAEADLDGRILVQSGDVRELTGKIEYPALLQRFAKEPKFTGLLQTSRGLAVVAVSAVTDERGKEAPVGLMITGQLLTNDILQKLSDMLQTNVALLSQSKQYIATKGSATQTELNRLKADLADNTGTTFHMERVNGTYWSGAAEPLRDMGGNMIGLIHVQSPSVSATRSADNLASFQLYVLVVLIFLVGLVIFLLRKRILLPLRHFTRTMEEMAAGRQLEGIPSHVMHAEAQIVQAIQQIIRWNEQLEQAVERRTREIRNLLDHAGQGFMSVGPDLSINAEYSAECVRLLGKEPEGQPVHRLLHPHDDELAELTRNIFADYFENPDPNAKQLILSLLPEELSLGDRIVKAEYVPIPLSAADDRDSEPGNERKLSDSEAVMIMLTDLTETRRLESEMEKERTVLRMLVQAVTHPEDAAQIVKGFQRFHETEMAEIFADERVPVQQKALALCRIVHTFKGSFGFLRFPHIVPKLHELESGLLAFAEAESPAPDAADRLRSYVQSQKLERWLEDDLELLGAHLGEALTAILENDEGIRLTRGQWQELEEKLAGMLRRETDRSWLERFRSWRLRPAGVLFTPYVAYVTELAERNGIALHPVSLEGAEIPVDIDRLREFARSFVHVIRNVIVHGLETPDERLDAGKSPEGRLDFRVDRRESGIVIMLADDGRGIPPDALPHIFDDRFSTASELTESGGRGVGLPAVKLEVEKLGGWIEVRSEMGQGTTFIFTIPDNRERGAGVHAG